MYYLYLRYISYQMKVINKLYRAAGIKRLQNLEDEKSTQVKKII